MAANNDISMGGPRSDPGPRRAVAYVRISSASQAEGFGLEVQRDRVNHYANDHGLKLLGIVQETASGGVRNGEEFSWEHRPALLGIVSRAESGEFDVLLIPRYDRLSRDYATLVVLERRFQRLGVEIVSVAEETNGDGPIGEFIRGQLALAAQLERALIRDRLTAGKAKARESGRRAEGRPPYGYIALGHGELEIDHDAAPIVRRIFTEATEGRTPGWIARRLNRDNIPSPRGASWSAQGIQKMLTNETYVGRKGGHEGIISRRRFNQAQAALAARARS